MVPDGTVSRKVPNEVCLGHTSSAMYEHVFFCSAYIFEQSSIGEYVHGGLVVQQDPFGRQSATVLCLDVSHVLHKNERGIVIFIPVEVQGCKKHLAGWFWWLFSYCCMLKHVGASLGVLFKHSLGVFEGFGAFGCIMPHCPTPEALYIVTIATATALSTISACTAAPPSLA